MKKSTFIRLTAGVMGGFLFAIGMCMCLIAEWNARTPGLVCTGIGLIALLLLAKDLIPKRNVSWKAVGKVLYGILAAMVLGVGMCLVLVWNQLVWGIVVGAGGCPAAFAADSHVSGTEINCWLHYPGAAN